MEIFSFFFFSFLGVGGGWGWGGVQVNSAPVSIDRSAVVNNETPKPWEQTRAMQPHVPGATIHLCNNE